MSAPPAAPPATFWLRPIPDQIPSRLRDTPRWVAWRAVWTPEREKFDKLPVNARTGQLASSTDPATWAPFDVAWHYYLARAASVHGIGFVVVADDEIVGFDFDHARDPDDGSIDPKVARFLAQLDSYTEVSPSGRGLRVFALGTLPPTGRKRGTVEVYSEGRYLTVTGHRLPESPTEVESRPDAILRVHREVWPPDVETPTGRTRTSGSLDDDALLVRARAAANGARFAQLYDTGDWRGAGFLSQSEADLALCGMLAFWTGHDRARIDQLFQRSALMRAKWDERHGAATYGALTVAKALHGGYEVYSGVGSRNGVGHVEGVASSDTLEPAHLTDAGNAQRFARDHAGRVRHCWRWKRWLIWDGRRWKIDDGDQVAALAKETARRIYVEAARTDDPTERRQLAKYAQRSESRDGLEAMVALARSEPGIPVDAAQLDADPWLLNVRNGTLDLRTGQLRPHDPGERLTRLAPVEFDPAATAPRWLAFLDRIFEGRASLIAFMQRVAGYSLTGDTSERALFVLHGRGANGKSTFLRALMDTFGEYAVKTPAQTLMTKAKGAIPNDVARLAGARLVVASETGEDQRFDESLVKELTGGADKITGRLLFAEWFEFVPTFKVIFATNHRPTVRGTDEAIWDRVRLVPFNVRIPEAERDPHLLDALRAELPGILAWAVRGCLDWQRQGLGVPDEVREATGAYRDEQDRLGAFLRACCVTEPRARVAFALLYDAYRAWVTAADEVALSETDFGKELKGRGYVRKRGTGGVAERIGLRLREPGEESEGTQASDSVTGSGPGFNSPPYARARGESIESGVTGGHSVTRDREPAWARGEDEL